MNLRHLQYFRVIAETEHITQAAERLSITQPSLSHAISELEKELGTHLFEKHGRNIRLTKYGRLFLEYVCRALDELDRGEHLIRELTSPDTGQINLAFVYSLGAHFVPLMVQSFTAHAENKQFTLKFHQGTTKNIIQGLKDEQYDIAFCSYAENEPSIEFIPFAEQELVVITPLDHPLAQYDSIGLQEIASYPLIYFNQKSGLRPIVDELFTKVHTTPNIIFEVEEDNAMAGLVSVGLGIAIIPRISMLHHYNVKILKITNPTFKRLIYVASVHKRYLPPAATKFRNFAIKFGKELYLEANKLI